MSEETEKTIISDEERQVLMQYGATMLLVQRFEWALKQLSLYYTEVREKTTFEEAWKVLETNLKLAAGPLITQLENRGNVPEKFLKELRVATKLRNYLAHEYLFVVFVVEKSWGIAKPQDDITYLKAKSRYFHELYTVVYSLLRERQREWGVDRILDSDIGHLIDEVIREKMLEDESEEA